MVYASEMEEVQGARAEANAVFVTGCDVQEPEVTVICVVVVGIVVYKVEVNKVDVDVNTVFLNDAVPVEVYE